jgi:hypothetical protein
MGGIVNHAFAGPVDRLDAAQLCRGAVVDVTEPGVVIVQLEGDDVPQRRCALLVTSEAEPPVLAPGDEVLAWVPAGGTGAVVIGRIGASRGPSPDREDLPDTLTIEAKHALTLRVGEGSVTIREDGRILIKGRDLVSHAQRMNRIRGGAVAIN